MSLIRKTSKSKTTDELVQHELLQWQQDLYALLREDTDDQELREWVLWIISDLPCGQLSEKELRQCLKELDPTSLPS